MVTVKKRNGRLRICLDPKDLNRVVKRSNYPLPTMGELLPELTKAKVFSTFDIKNGFWHIQLDEASSKSTTFNTPFGRYRWLRLPFGLSSAPEIFQSCQHQAVEGLQGVLSIFDKILVHEEGETEEEATRDHDAKVHALMERCHERNIKLNKEKAQLHRKEVPFKGHVITNEGLKADPEKLRVVLEMPTPTDVAWVQRFVGFANCLGKFLPKLSAECEPLLKLTFKDAV